MGLSAARFSAVHDGELPLYEADEIGLFRAGERWRSAAIAKKNGRNEEPTAGITDSQSVMGTAESAEEPGFDGGKKVEGRKHPIAIDTTGCALLATIHAADVHDKGARPLFERPFEAVPTVKWILADQAYEGDRVKWVKTTFSCTPDIVYKTAKEFTILPRRWVIERTFAWLSRHRRLAREHEKRPASSVAMIYVASIRVMLKKMHPKPV